MQDKKQIFALDIGTRSVNGIILKETDGEFHVVDLLAIEHRERSMLDGQIHDVLSVANIIVEMKTALEQKHGPLSKVCVAAAGRALKTERSEITININGKPMIKKDDILHLELTAVQQAQTALAEREALEKSYHYYCVGYSVLYYRLDGEEIGSLIDQSGETASVEIIATFLPKVVVESLLSALSRAGLEMEALTLEPIAAINVLIPPSMRRLNVALVDIGAGTSDIAITELNTVTAYGMVPVAGDEITEAISDQLLLDFQLAEKAKRDLHTCDIITITDILGFETQITRDEVLAQILPALDRLATAISDEILILNGKSPKAVMLVGGGSLTPMLPKLIAEKLNLPENRVAIRGTDAINGLTIEPHIQKGPELVTPIGIAIAARKSPVHYVTVQVNNQPIRLFEMKQLTVGDSLLAAGIQIKKLYGKPGIAMFIVLNGQPITIPGKHGDAPTLLKNGVPCSLDDPITNNDHLYVEKGPDGTAPKITVKELIDEVPHKLITLNGENYRISASLTCNQVPCSLQYMLNDGDKIECRLPENIEQLLDEIGQLDLLSKIKPFTLKINGKKTMIPALKGKIIRNGIEVTAKNHFEHLDVITVENKNTPTVAEFAELQHYRMKQSIPVIFNGKKVTLTKTLVEFYRNKEKLHEQDLIKAEDEITVELKKIEPFIFQDVFKYVEIKMPKDANSRFKLIKNGEETSFHDQIQPGDELQIIWPEKKESELKKTRIIMKTFKS